MDQVHRVLATGVDGGLSSIYKTGLQHAAGGRQGVFQAQRALAGDEAVSGSRFTRRARLGPRDRADAQLSVGERVNLFSGEPDALAALVRLDERGVKTEQDAASEAPADERVGNR
jgi:hypothetical protein